MHLNQNKDDEDQGFVPTKIQIRKQVIPIYEMATKPLDFQARYIIGNDILKKQPKAIYQRFDQYLPPPIKQYSNLDFVGQKKYAMKFQDFLSNKSYKLVYSRYNQLNKNSKRVVKPIGDKDLCINNQINLSSSLASYQPENYAVFKNNEGQFLASQSNQAITNLLKSVSLGNVSPSLQNVTPLQEVTKQLMFDSKFEGGNLLSAFKNIEEINTYYLFMQNDTNTVGYNQWFYFSVKNVEPGVSYRFLILNFRKRNLLFKDKMKISVFSLVQALKKGKKGSGWRKMGENIKYERSLILKSKDANSKNINKKYYCLSFSLTFEHQHDYISIAMNPPYTYSRLIYNIKLCQELIKQNKSILWQLSSIAHSVANNSVPYITITSKKQQIVNQPQVNKQYPQFPSLKFHNKSTEIKYQTNLHAQFNTHPGIKEQENIKQSEKSPQKQEKKKVIIFLARQHPGETWSSFLMQQLLYYFAEKQSTQSIKWLLENFIVKIFPMVNVDGVIYGNFRCDLGGFDLNRTWKQPHKDLHPQIYKIKKQIQKLNEQYEIEGVFDLHGHSKKYNIFCYSCENRQQTARILPKMISEANSLFHFPSCTFGISKYKQTTARAVIYNIINNQNVCTIQNSFYGMKIGNQYQQFQPSMFRKMAGSIIETLCNYFKGGQHKKAVQKDVKQNLPNYLKYQTRQDDDSGSDSDPYEDEIAIKQKIHIFPTDISPISQEREPKREIKKKKKMISKEKNDKKIQINIGKPQKFKKQQVINEITENDIVYKKSTIGQRNTIRTMKAIQPLHFEQHQQVKKVDLSERAFGKYRLESKKPLSFQNLGTVNQKPKLIPINIRKDSMQIFRDAYMSNNRNFEDQVAKSLRKMSKHKQVLNNIPNQTYRTKNPPSNSQLPLLCIFSERQKIQIEESRLHRKQSDLNNITQKFRQYGRNGKIQRIKKKQKQKNIPLNKGWKNNYSQFGLNIFFGDLQ